MAGFRIRVVGFRVRGLGFRIRVVDFRGLAGYLGLSTDTFQDAKP